MPKFGKKELGLPELIAIALGGMVGGGIFAILGISVKNIGNATPIAFGLGGVLAFFAAYSYVKLALLYKDEGATYSFFKKTFPRSNYAASAIGWLVVFGYISTLALYAFTFSSYLCSALPFGNSWWAEIGIAGGIIGVFAVINLVSVKGMGKVEDAMVYLKLIMLLFIAGLLAGKGDIQQISPLIESETTIGGILMIAAVTFVAFEGFQLVIHAYDEMENPSRNIPRAIYSAVVIAALLYVILAIAALVALPKDLIIEDKEYALAAGANEVLGGFGYFAVILGALLATSSAISGTLFGASRLMAVIAEDGFFPKILARRSRGHTPNIAIIAMSLTSFALILSGSLRLILEFGSITFIGVSFLMAYSNYKMRKQTGSGVLMTWLAMIGLASAALLIIIFEVQHSPRQLAFIGGLYLVIILVAYLFSKKKTQKNDIKR